MCIRDRLNPPSNDVHMEGPRADNAPARGLDTQLAHPENTRRAFVPTDYFRNGGTRHSVFFFSFSQQVRSLSSKDGSS